MKWRNQLLALFCLALFVAGGVFYFRHWVVQKPYGIILFIGEGLDPRSLATARVSPANDGKPLAIDGLPFSALLRNHSLDSAAPDAAAAATALATGTKVNNGAIALSPQGGQLQSILQIARNRGHMVGLVTNGSLTAPTAASFYAHGHATDSRAAFAEQLVEQAKIDVILGGGASDFASVAAGGTRADERDLIGELRDSGYEVVRTLLDLEDVARWRRAKLVGLFSQGEMDYAQDVERLDDQPTLADLVRRAIELLQYSRGGYVLVVDAALVRKARDESRSDRATSELLELDKAVAVALEYAGNKAAVFVCGDNATSARLATALPVSADPSPQSDDEISSVAEPEPEMGGTPAAVPTAGDSPEASADAAEITLEEPAAEAQAEPSPSSLSAPPSPADAAQDFANDDALSGAVVAEDAVVFGSGLGADALHGSLEDTEIFEIIRDNL
jgi:alkaline phosphatase